MVIGGEEGIREVHGWSRYTGPGLVLKDTIVIEACIMIAADDSDRSRRAQLLESAITKIWEHPDLTHLWKRDMEADIKKTLRSVIMHRRVKFSVGERTDWPEEVPKPESLNGKPMKGKRARKLSSTPSDNSSISTLTSFTSSTAQPLLSDMILSVSRYGIGGIVREAPFEVRVANLTYEGSFSDPSTIKHVGMLKFSVLVHLLADKEDGMAFDPDKETIIKPPKAGFAIARIRGQYGFEAALQHQYNLKLDAFQLAVCSIDALNDDDSNPTAPPAIGLRPVESSDLTNYEQCLKRKGSHDEYLVAKRQQQQPDDFSTPPPMPDPFVHGYSGVNQSQSSG